MATYKLDLPEGGFVHFDAPDNAPPEQVEAAAQARYAQHAQNLQKEVAKGREEFDPTKDMTGSEKVLANLGAGFANLGQGVESLKTKAFGSKQDQAAMDADIWEKRARDEQLANATTGGGALQLAGEIAPTLLIPGGGLASVAGRGAAQAAAGLRAAQGLSGVLGAGARGLGNVALAPVRGAVGLGRDLAGVGAEFGAAGKAAYNADKLGDAWNVLKATRAAQLGQSSGAADAALAGGLSGALAPTTSDESTLARIAGGAALGGAVPVLGKQVGNLASRFNPWGTGESAAARVIGEQLGAGGGQAERMAAARQVADQLRAHQASLAGDAAQLGEGIGEDIGAGGAGMGAGAPRARGGDMGAGGFDPGASAPPVPSWAGGGAEAGDLMGTAGAGAARRPGAIPLSTAAILNNPQLAHLEIGSRARNAANWSGHDTAYQQALVDALHGATGEASQIGERVTQKNANWQANMEEALSNADPEVFADHVQALQNHVEDWLAHDPERFDAPVRKVYEQLRSDLAGAGEGFNPADMQVIRRNFAGKQNIQNPSAYKAAPRDSHAVQDVIGRLDNALNDTTGGAWDTVKQGYTQDVAKVNQAKAAQQLHESFYTPEGQIRGTATGIAGDLPTLSEAGFARAAQRGEGMYSPQAAQQVQAITDALRAQNITQRLKKTGTAGGGSATAPTLSAMGDVDTVASALGGVLKKLPYAENVAGVAQGLRRAATVNQDRALAEALQNPDAMLRLLTRVQESGRPLSAGQRALLQTLRTGTTTASRAASD